MAAQRECRVERGPSHDVPTDAQPVRIQVRVADPALKGPSVPGEWSTGRHDRPCRGEPEEVCTLHLSDEEVVIGRKRERRREYYVERHLLAGHEPKARGRRAANRVVVLGHNTRAKDLLSPSITLQAAV